MVGIVSASSAESAMEAAERMETMSDGSVSDAEAAVLLNEAMEKGNVRLVKSVIAAMRRSLVSGGDVNASGSGVGQKLWPPLSTDVQKRVVKGLALQLLVRDAADVLRGVKSGGVPEGGEVVFGDIVTCPLDERPLAVMQPLQKSNVVAAQCAECRYGYRLVAGRVTKVESEAMDGAQKGLVGAVASLRKFVPGLRQNDLVLRHSIIVTGADGQDRAFEASTATDEVPARVDDRVTVVCATPNASDENSTAGRVFDARAPGRVANEPMLLQNHTTNKRHELLRPPSDLERLTTTFLASSVLLVPALGAMSTLLAADGGGGNTEAAGALMQAGADLAAVSIGAATLKFNIEPRLRQIADESQMDFVLANQALLDQYRQLQTTIAKLVDSGEDDINVMARLQQLENKMRSVSGQAATPSATAPTMSISTASPSATTARAEGTQMSTTSLSYSARLDRVINVRAETGAKLDGIIDLIANYGRICSMIEIEIEMNTSVGDVDSVRRFAVGVDEELDALRNRREEVEAQSKASEELERILSDTL